MYEEVGMCVCVWEGGDGGGGRESQWKLMDWPWIIIVYNSVVQPTNSGSAPSNLKILLKCVSGNAELLRISKFCSWVYT